jgi:hypothetical protein
MRWQQNPARQVVLDGIKKVSSEILGSRGTYRLSNKSVTDFN